MVETDTSFRRKRPGNLILLAGGSDQTKELVIGRNTVNLKGINDARKLLSATGYKFEFFLFTPNYFKKRIRVSPPNYRLIFNLISDVDINSKTLAVLERVLANETVPVLNHPSRIKSTTRDQVAARLDSTTGIIVPKTLRLNRNKLKFSMNILENSGFRFPGILRPVGTHGGEGVSLVSDKADLATQLRQYREGYLTEFADFKSQDGYYRKYRCFLIGDSVVFRHLIISDRWLIHARDKSRVMGKVRRFEEEEAAIHAAGASYFDDRQIAAMRRIQRILGLDYLGLDFGITSKGRLLLFEANATMNFFPFTNRDQSHYSWQCLPIAIEAMRLLVANRLQGADQSSIHST